MKKKSVYQKSIEAGINLRGTPYFGLSAKELRKRNPELAERWAKFIKENKKQFIAEISDLITI